MLGTGGLAYIYIPTSLNSDKHVGNESVTSSGKKRCQQVAWSMALAVSLPAEKTVEIWAEPKLLVTSKQDRNMICITGFV